MKGHFNSIIQMVVYSTAILNLTINNSSSSIDIASGDRSDDIY